MPNNMACFDKLKAYIGIKFQEGGQNDVVHKTWITKWSECEKTVLYPPSIYNVREFARQKKTPQEDWKDYQFVPLCHSSK